MSLSQKHPGKVLVPWFNIAEWKAVYNLIYSEAPDWPKALTILKIWKLRTPLLSAGVEGTLIVLEALLVNTNQLSSFERSHIFSTSLVRFLNLCATNSDKQGTFYKTALKNQLPKWLINLRHDIAHSHKIPALSVLEMSLRFCLDWLKGKYWDVQIDNMVDFVVGVNRGTVVEDAIFIYQHLDESHKNLSYKIMKRVNKYMEGTHNQISRKQMLDVINNKLKEEIKVNRETSSDKISTLLINDSIILLAEVETDHSGSKKIPLSFLKKWNGLLDVIHETGIMPCFVNHFFQFLLDERNDLSHREVASLWIQEIFKSLNNKEKNINDENSLSFTSNNKTMKNKSFVNEMLEKCNQFSCNFAKEVLEYNDAPPQLVDDFLNLLSVFNAKTNGFSGDRIFSIDDLNLAPDEIINEPIRQPKSRWILIEDTAPFVNLPLGVLPHQDRRKNPVLAL